MYSCLYIYIIIKTNNNMKKLNFKTFLDENIDEIKDLLVNIFECDKDDVDKIVSFEDDELGGFISCNKEGECVVFGLSLYNFKVDEEEVGVEMKMINSREVYFVIFEDF